MQRFQPLIAAMTASISGDQQARQAVEQRLASLAQSPDWAALAAALRRVLAGDRDEAELLPGLDDIDTAILRGTLSSVAASH